MGFSTGALAKGDFRRGIEVQRMSGRIDAVELSALRDHELPELVKAVPALDLQAFGYVSVHAPSKLQILDEQTVFDLLLELPESWTIVAHPEILRTQSLWRRLGRRLCLENMDDRKTTGRTPVELRELFEQFPDAGFCLDLGHARQIDPTMASALQMLREFGGRMRQMHVSEVGTHGEHLPLGATTRMSFAQVAHRVPANCPLIIESVIPAEAIERELDAVSAVFEPAGTCGDGVVRRRGGRWGAAAGARAAFVPPRRPYIAHMTILAVFVLAVTLDAQQPAAGTVSIEPYPFRTFDGKEIPAELGKLWVRENRNGSSNRLIQLTFVRLKWSGGLQAAGDQRQPEGRRSKGSPIVFLAGGPGVPAIGMGRVPVYFRLFQQLRSVSDVILLDQRGLGMSSPALDCPATPVPPDVFASMEKWLSVVVGKSRSCAEHWRAKGVEISAYTNDASADDLNDLRQALGAERISLIGHSYGTLLAQAAVRRHGKHLDRVVFAATEGPDNLLALPSVWDALIRKLSHLAGEDLEAPLRRVLDKLDREPVKLDNGITVGKIGLQWLLRHGMTDARNYARIPALLHAIDQGDYSLLTKLIVPLHRAMQGRSPMANAVDCSIGWSATRLAAAARETPGALFSNVNLQRTAEICKAVGVKPHDPASQPRLFSLVLALFVSGTLDANTPPFQAEEVRWGFPNSTHLIVENGGHETLPSADVQAVVVDFFKGVEVKGRAVSFEPPDFQRSVANVLPSSASNVSVSASTR